MSSNNAKPFTFKHLLMPVNVSHEALATILLGMNINICRDLCMPSHDGVLVELRGLQVVSSANPMRLYLIVFAFSREKANRLLLIDDVISKNVVDNLVLAELLTPLSRRPWTGTTLLLVGKTGSKELTKFSTLWNHHKVVHVDFPSKSSVEDFTSMLLSDIEKIEQKGDQSKTTDGIDLSNLPLSEKRIRIQEDMSEHVKQETVFANQLLQIPGISEIVAQSIARRFKRPIALMAHVESSNALNDFTYSTAKGEFKKLNVRIKNTLFRLCNQGVVHDELIR